MAKAENIALERIDILMEKAQEVFPMDRERANRYAGLARKIAIRHALRFPPQWKRRICKGCGVFLMPGTNCRVRTHEDKVVIACLECEGAVKIPFRRERKERRRAKARKASN